MKKKLIVMLVTSIFFITGFYNINASSYLHQKSSEWTVMIYMAADNDLEDHGQNDINKIRAATQDDDLGSVNIIILYDKYGKGNSQLKSISNGVVEEIDDNNFIIPDSNEVNMGDPQTLVNFGKWVMENYPANHYMLILWGHGFESHPAWARDWANSDWFYTACVDVISKDSIKIARHELFSALDEITNHGYIKFDIIGFDTCLNALLEVAYEVKDCASLMIAPQDNQYMFNPQL